MAEAEAKWYVIHTYSGYENKVKEDIEKTVENRHLEDLILEVRVPMEEVREIKNGVARMVQHKLFPGYVFAQLELYLDDRRRRLNKPLWEYVNGLQGVIGFLGAVRSPRGEMVSPPTPMTDEEVANIRATMGSPEDKPKVKVTFEPGEDVRIVDGPFLSSIGTVQTVDPEKGDITVTVPLFGGDTPVDLKCWQVERLEKKPEDEKPQG